MDVGFEGSEDGCDNPKDEVPGRSWPEVVVMQRHFGLEEGEHHQLLESAMGHSHCCIAVAAAEAADSCRSAAERSPWRGIDDRTDDRRIAIAEVVVAVACYGSWMSKTVSGDGSATAWPLPGRVRRV